CEYCACDFFISHGGIHDVMVHPKTAKHRSNAKLNRSLSSSSGLKNTWANPHNPVNDGAIKAEVLFQGFVLQHNLPFAVNDGFNKLVARMFPDSDIAKRYAMGSHKGKSSYSLYWERKSEKNCYQTLEKYSLSTDGSSDNDDKYFPILATCEDSEGLTGTRFLDMPTVNYAKNIAEIVEKYLSTSGLSLSNGAAFVSDNASAMIGKHRGVPNLLQEKRSGGKIYGVGCACHLAHLAAKQGAKALSFDPQDFLVDLFYHFDKRAKQKEMLREDISFCNETIRKVLKRVSTRWLSMSCTLERVLEIWDGLRCYFLTHYDDDTDEPGPSKRQKTNGREGDLSGARERRLVLFLHATIPRFDTFNMLLQREDPMIHRLQPVIMKLYQELLGCLMKPSVIMENKDDLLAIEVTAEDLQKSNADLFIGFASLMIRKQDLDGSCEVGKFHAEMRGFYQKALVYMKQKFPLKDSILKAVVVFDPENRVKSNLSMIETPLEKFPDVIPQNRTNELFMEFMLYTCPDLPTFSSQEDRIDKFWHQVSQLIEPATGQQQFRLLSQLAKYALLLPHSNAFCESIFSTVRKNTTEARSSLGIRNNLCTVMASKINVFKNTPCTVWSPSSDLIQSCQKKKRTVKAPKSQKKK
uniref:HAT C-terminal dimerisation domain-containing protein n=1 Tax=Latimeria chalumnae TaxID=7897 RepID=H3AC39_LATCH